MIANGEPADNMFEPSHLFGWANQFIDRKIAMIFPGRTALHLGVTFDPHHQLDSWNHGTPPIFLNCPQVA